MPAGFAQGVFKDVYCDTIDAAFEEMRRRKTVSGAEGTITRFEESPYGGYSVSAELYVDELLEPVRLRMRRGGISGRKAVYR